MLMWYSICDCLAIGHLNIWEAASFTSACPNTSCWISCSQFSTMLSTVVKTNVMGYFITEWPALIIQILAFINSSSMRCSSVCEWLREESHPSSCCILDLLRHLQHLVLIQFKQTNQPTCIWIQETAILLCGDRSTKLMSLVYMAKARSINSQGIQSSHTAFPKED